MKHPLALVPHPLAVVPHPLAVVPGPLSTENTADLERREIIYPQMVSVAHLPRINTVMGMDMKTISRIVHPTV